MQDKIFLEQNGQEILNIVEALQFYKNNAIKPYYKNIIDEQITNIINQLEAQDIELTASNQKPLFDFGQKVKYEDKIGYVIGMSNENEFIKIVINNNENIEDIDVPIVLLEKLE